MKQTVKHQEVSLSKGTNAKLTNQVSPSAATCLATLTAFFVCIFSLPVFSADILIYKDLGACRGCAEAPAQLARSLKLTTRYVQASMIQASKLANAKVWIQPKMQILRDFIAQGGSYIGICAGAFFADATVDDAETIPGLGLIPGETYDYLTHNNPIVVTVNWLGNDRPMYFQGGPAFRIAKQDESRVEVLARYKDNSPAAIRFLYGRGKVILVGPHPEAPSGWFEADGLAIPDGHNNDVALDIIRSALQD
jgi:glutamine amidotransferase-like uncharacterized protein